MASTKRLREIFLDQLAELELCELLDLITEKGLDLRLVYGDFYPLCKEAFPHRDLVVIAAVLRNEERLLEDLLALYLPSLSYLPLRFIHQQIPDLLELPYPRDFGYNKTIMITVYATETRWTLNAFDRASDEALGHVLLMSTHRIEDEPYSELPIEIMDYAKPLPPCCYIIYLKSLREGEGIGTHLLKATSYWAEQNGLKYLLLERLPTLKSFYEKRGFSSIRDPGDLCSSNDSFIMIGSTQQVQASCSNCNLDLI